MALQGADTAKLRALGKRFMTSSQRIDQVVAELSKRMGEVQWHGGDAERIRSTFERELRPVGRSAAQSVAAAGKNLIEQARQQDETSAAGGGATGGGQSGPKFATNTDDPDALDVRYQHNFLWFHWGRKTNPPETSAFRNKPLYEDGIAAYDVYQNGIGDCYLAAAFSALANTPAGRQFIDDMIVENDDGTFTVTFPGKAPVTVDGDLYGSGDVATYGTPQSDKWFAIIEKAYAKQHGGYSDIVGGRQFEVFDELGLDGVKTNTADLSNKEVTDLLLSAQAEGRPVTVSAELHQGGPSDVLHRESKGGFHALTVTYISPPDESGYSFITVRNPWGADGGLLADGVMINGDGTMIMDVEHFRKLFYDIEYVASPIGGAGSGGGGGGGGGGGW